MAQQQWAFVAMDSAGNELGELTAAQSRSLTARVDGPWSASVSMSGRNPQAALLTELDTDLVVYLNGAKLFRGRVGPTQDDVGEDAHTVTFTALDYRAILDRRLLYEGDTLAFVGVDQAAVAWALVGNTQAQTGGYLGITGPPANTGVTRTRTFEAGKPVGEAITQLSQVVNGFEWRIDGNLALVVYFPEQGANNGYVLDYGGTVSRVRRAFDPATFANGIRATGDPALTTERRSSAGIAVDPRGRFDQQFGFPDVLEQTTLGLKADFLLADRSVLRPSYAVDLKAGRWGAELALGDTAQLVVSSGRLAVNESARVIALTLALDPHGAEKVTATLGRPDAVMANVDRIIDYEKRLRNLENQ